MKRTSLVVGLIVTAAFSTLLPARSGAAQIQVTSMVGNWRDPNYSGTCSNNGTSGAQCGITNGDPTSSINWGGTVAQSGYDFTKSIPGPITVPSSSQFSMGSFTHRNKDLSVNPSQVSLRNVKLDVIVNLTVDGTPIGPLTFTYTFTHDETNNTSNISQCDPAKMNPNSTVPCPDVVTLTGSAAPTSFVVGGVNYTLTMGFVTGQNPQPLSKFITEELQTNLATLVGQFTVAQNAPVVTFTANPASIQSGQSSVLNWTTQNATQVDINQGVGNGLALNGNATVSPNATTVYTLTATGPGGQTNVTATVNVTAASQARLDINPASITVNEDAGFARVTVVRSVNTSQGSSVEFATSNGSASANQDYMSVSGTVEFSAGETTKTFDIPLIDDALVETNETINLTISNAVNATIGTGQGTVTIIDNDSTNPPPPPPAPNLTALVPFSAPVSLANSFTLRLVGTDFNTTGAVVIWNNAVTLTPLTRTATELTVTINPSLWSNTAGAYPVKVRNPGPLDSNSLPFTVRPLGSGNPPPWVVRDPSANPNPVVGGTSTQLDTLGGTFSSNGSESVLTYTWTANGPAPVSFSSNGTNAAKNATAVFQRAGNYTFYAKITDTVTRFSVFTKTLSVDVIAGVGSVTVNPKSISLLPGQNYPFSAAVKDQFGAAFSAPVTWSSSAGAIAGSGSFTAPQQGANITITATAGGKSDSAQVNVIVDGAGGSGDLTNVKVGPVPYKVNSGDPGVTFRNLPAGATIRIFTTGGRIVQTYNISAFGDQVWDIRNANLDRVSSGVYLYRIESGEHKKEGKLVVIQ